MSKNFYKRICRLVGHYAQGPELIFPDSKSRSAYAKRLTERIISENSHIGNRLTWLLQLNGFLFSAYGLALNSLANAQSTSSSLLSINLFSIFNRTESQNDIILRFSVLFKKNLIHFDQIITVTGISSGVFSLIGVSAAFSSLNKLKGKYIRNCQNDFDVPPFSAPYTSALGRTPSLCLPLILLSLWLYLWVRTPASP